MKNILKRIFLFSISIIIFNASLVLADGITDLKLYSGTINLLRDATTALLVILPISCGLCILYFQWQKGMADIQEQSMWSKRTKIALISLAIGFGATGIVNIFTRYYSG